METPTIAFEKVADIPAEFSSIAVSSHTHLESLKKHPIVYLIGKSKLMIYDEVSDETWEQHDLPSEISTATKTTCEMGNFLWVVKGKTVYLWDNAEKSWQNCSFNLSDLPGAAIDAITCSGFNPYEIYIYQNFNVWQLDLTAQHWQKLPTDYKGNAYPSSINHMQILNNNASQLLFQESDATKYGVFDRELGICSQTITMEEVKHGDVTISKLARSQYQPNIFYTISRDAIVKRNFSLRSAHRIELQRPPLTAVANPRYADIGGIHDQFIFTAEDYNGTRQLFQLKLHGYEY